MQRVMSIESFIYRLPREKFWSSVLWRQQDSLHGMINGFHGELNKTTRRNAPDIHILGQDIAAIVKKMRLLRIDQRSLIEKTIKAPLKVTPVVAGHRS
jgi:hypothetical protein